MRRIQQSVFCILLANIISLQVLAQETTIKIAVNQLGFYPNAQKQAIIINASDAVKFYILSINKKDTLFSGNVQPPIQSDYSSSITKKADFSNFKKTGKYIMYVPTVGYSYPFEISKNRYHEVAKASIKGYYYQRASMPLQQPYAGIWARKEGHPDTTVYIHPSAATNKRIANTVIPTPGGWYDAGDYNKYIVNSGITMGTLMSGYEDFTAYFDSLKINIPESNNGIPDILNEVLYNLRWMLTMQDKDDGGVYHKCTNAKFDAMIMPDAAVAKRYVVQKGTAATLDFAAVMAQASRIYKKFQAFSGLADSCLTASKFAWQWAIKNPSIAYNQNEINRQFLPAVVTGDYGDNNFKDEFFWAAAELLVTTKDNSYISFVEKETDNEMILPSWADVNILGCYTLLRLKKQLPVSINNSIETISKKLSYLADNLISNGGNKAFATIFGQSNKDFVWGSNAIAMNESALLINAYLLNKNKKYLMPALSNIDYVLGQNATGYSFVTGFGTKYAMHPHHRPSVADNITEPLPGLLVGGPNPGMQDKCFYANKETETAYMDDDCAYACNEIAINWNAPLVYVLNAMEALQSHLQ